MSLLLAKVGGGPPTPVIPTVIPAPFPSLKASQYTAAGVLIEQTPFLGGYAYQAIHRTYEAAAKSATFVFVEAHASVTCAADVGVAIQFATEILATKTRNAESHVRIQAAGHAKGFSVAAETYERERQTDEDTAILLSML